MKKTFVEPKGKLIKDQGRKLIELTLDKKVMHFLFQAIAKYQEVVTNSVEKEQLEVLIAELNKINDVLNEEEIT